MSGKAQTAETLIVMIGAVESKLKDAGIDQEQATKLAALVVDDIRHQCGGMSIYIPKGIGLDTLLKHDQIWQDFRGNNHTELAKKYDLSEQRIYQIVRAIHAAEVKKRQPQLF